MRRCSISIAGRWPPPHLRLKTWGIPPMRMSSNWEDPYKVLGLTRGASKEEARKAFRTMAKKYHPDRQARFSENDPRRKEAATKMAAVNAAWERIEAGDTEPPRGPFSQSSSGGSAGPSPQDIWRAHQQRMQEESRRAQQAAGGRPSSGPGQNPFAAGGPFHTGPGSASSGGPFSNPFNIRSDDPRQQMFNQYAQFAQWRFTSNAPPGSAGSPFVRPPGSPPPPNAEQIRQMRWLVIFFILFLFFAIRSVKASAEQARMQRDLFAQWGYGVRDRDPSLQYGSGP